MTPTTVTIVTPSYNRAHTLLRLFESVEKQSTPCLELILVDDGSTDDTRTLVCDYAKRAGFKLVYVRQENQGKHVALNHGVSLASGNLTFFVDSDDWLTPESIEYIVAAWESIPEASRDDFAGVEGLCAFENGDIAGTSFPQDPLDSNYIEARQCLGVDGDKKAAMRTDVLKQFPYPQFQGEKHIRDSLLWKEIALRYNTRHINRVVQTIEYQQDGLSADVFSMRTSNPRGFAYYYLQDVTRFQVGQSFAKRFDSMVKFVRYSFLSGLGVSAQRRKMPLWLWWLALPAGWLKFIRDKKRLAKNK